jgi:hypothetical protein
MSTRPREYHKTATVLAHQVPPGAIEQVSVASLEQPATARAGDWVVTSTGGGRSWVVAGDVFQATYAPVGRQSVASTARSSPPRRHCGS